MGMGRGSPRSTSPGSVADGGWGLLMAAVSGFVFFEDLDLWLPKVTDSLPTMKSSQLSQVHSL